MKLRVKYFLSFVLIISCIVFQSPFVPTRELFAAQETDNAKKYDFRIHYAYHSIPLWETILHRFKGRPNIRYLEIGLGEGESTIWMLEHVLTHPSARMVGIDIFSGGLKKRFLANLKISGFAHKVKIINGRSQVELKYLPADSFDIIYVDGTHFAADVLVDAVLSWPLLKNDGLLIFDDYLMSTIPPGPERLPDSLAKDTKTRIPYLPLEVSPKVAADVFITAYRNNLEIVYRGFQLILKKTRKDNFYLSFGQYLYSWWEKQLYIADKKEIVPLSDDERKLIERLFISRGIGETGFRLDAEILKDRNFIDLKNRLNLDFREESAK